MLAEGDTQSVATHIGNLDYRDYIKHYFDSMQMWNFNKAGEQPGNIEEPKCRMRESFQWSLVFAEERG